METKLDASIYDNQLVKEAMHRAERRGRESGEGWTVFVDPTCHSRIWVSPSSEPAPQNGEWVFSTEDGRRFE